MPTSDLAPRAWGVPTVKTTAERNRLVGVKLVYNEEVSAFQRKQSNGTWVTGTPASGITSGIFDTARLGSGTATVLKFLRGDGTWDIPVQYTVTPWDFANGQDLTNSSTDRDLVAAALESAANAAMTEGYGFQLSTRSKVAGIFRPSRALVFTGDILVWDGNGGATHAIGNRIEWQSNAASWGIRVQSAAGAGGNGSCPSGGIRNLTLTRLGTLSAAQTGDYMLQLRGMRQFHVENVTAQGADIGFDAIDNCFGSIWTNCRVPVSQANVGINVRTGTQSGNDLYFFANWIAGQLAAVHIAGGSNNFHFEGGQYSAGQGKTADDDAYGVFTICKDYLTGAIAALGNINLCGLDYEDVRRVWMLRSYGQFNADITNSTYLANTSSGQRAIGHWKGESITASKVRFQSNRIVGTFGYGVAGGVINSLAGQSSAFHLSEDGWDSPASTTDQYGAAGGPTAQSAGWHRSVQENAGLNVGIAVSSVGGRAVVRLNGLTLQENWREATPSEAVLVSGIDCLTGGVFRQTITAGRTIGVPLNPQVGQQITFVFIQNGTGGFAIAWNAIFKGLTWSNTGNTANTRSSISFRWDGTNWSQVGAQAPWAA